MKQGDKSFKNWYMLIFGTDKAAACLRICKSKHCTNTCPKTSKNELYYYYHLHFAGDRRGL